jgi:hypothetical protein
MRFRRSNIDLRIFRLRPVSQKSGQWFAESYVNGFPGGVSTVNPTNGPYSCMTAATVLNADLDTIYSMFLPAITIGTSHGSTVPHSLTLWRQSLSPTF